MHSESSESAKLKDRGGDNLGENWVNFYQARNKGDYANLISLKHTSLENLSENFIDFLSECLKLDVTDRQTPSSLLCHPVFRALNKSNSA